MSLACSGAGNKQMLPSSIMFHSDQAQLKADVIEQDTQEWQSNPSFAGLERVGGADLSYIKEDDTSACASLVVLSYPDLENRHRQTRPCSCFGTTIPIIPDHWSC
uniref:Uncharacterized protein n=1 Tax=Podarcis muralis TaxID=64176 RepID=A0A670HTI0_PODMU